MLKSLSAISGLGIAHTVRNYFMKNSHEWLLMSCSWLSVRKGSVAYIKKENNFFFIIWTRATMTSHVTMADPLLTFHTSS